MTSEKVVNEVEQGLKEVQAKARDFAEQRRAVAAGFPGQLLPRGCWRGGTGGGEPTHTA